VLGPSEIFVVFLHRTRALPYRYIQSFLQVAVCIQSGILAESKQASTSWQAVDYDFEHYFFFFLQRSSNIAEADDIAVASGNPIFRLGLVR
jgi:hypothetical protein